VQTKYLCVKAKNRAAGAPNLKKDHSNITHLPLDALIERLSLAGYEVSPRQRLQLWRTLQQFGADTLNDPAQLKYRLAPLIVTNAAEQEHFYQIFDKYLDDIQQYEPKTEEENPLRWWERIPTWGWAALLLFGLACLAGGLWYWLEQKETAILQAQHPRTVTVGETFTAQNISTGYDTTTTFRWELCDAETKEVEQSNEEHSDHWEVAITEQGNSPDKMLRLIARVGEERDTFRSTLQLQCAYPPKSKGIVVNKTIDTTRTITLNAGIDGPFTFEWDMGDGNTAEGYEIIHTYQKEGAYEVKLNISRPDAEGYCSQQLSRRISIGQKEYAFLTFQQLIADVPDRTAHFSTGTWLLMALIALLALYFWYRWLKQKPPPPDPERKARALQARFAHADRGPYQIPFRPQDDALRPGAELYRLAQVLRLRQEGLRTELDVPATIQNTIEQGGFPAVHLRRTTLPPNYLFLIDEQAPHSHQAQLYRYLLDFLRGQDVHIAAFWYKKTPARFWNAQYPKGLSLEQLQRLYPHYRLLVLGDAHAMLDPLAREQHQVQPKLAANFQRWKSRLLLTPLPANDWTYREAALYDTMAVFPSDTAGVESAMAYLETEQDEEDQRAMPSFTNWQAAHSQPPLPPETNYQKWSRPETYEHYFVGRDDLYRWFCALMVYPNPTWPLTLAIGKAIGAPLQFDNLLLLSRLPYLQGKPIPHRLRMQLLAKLDKVTIQQARTAVAEELKAAAPAARNSHANRKLQTQLAMQQFMLQPEEEEYREAMRHLLDANALNKREQAELEEGLQQQKGGKVNLEHFLSGKKQEATLPKTRRPLNADFYRALGLSALLLVLSVLVGLLDGSNRLSQYVGSTEAKAQSGFFWNSEIDSDSALLFHNQAIATWDSLRQRKAVLSPQDLQVIGDDFQLALKYRNGDYPLAAANAARNHYHRGLLHYHRYLQVRDTLSRVSAIFYFEQARLSDTLQADALHALGLLAYYQDDIPDATGYYNGLLVQGYFDTLQLQPNLRSLLFRMEGNAVQSNCLPPPALELLSGDSLCLGDTLRLRINRDKANIDYYLVRWGDGQVDTLQQAGEISHKYQFIDGEMKLSILIVGRCDDETQAYNITTKSISLYDCDQENLNEPGFSELVVAARSKIDREELNEAKLLIDRASGMKGNSPEVKLLYADYNSKLDQVYTDKVASSRDMVENGDCDRAISMLKEAINMAPGKKNAREWLAYAEEECRAKKDCNLRVKQYSMIGVQCVEITDRSTKVTMSLFNNSGNAVLFSLYGPSTREYAFYIVDGNNRKYYLKSISGDVSFGENQTLYSGDSKSFNLYFDKIPDGTREISIKEGTEHLQRSQNYWNFNNIKLDFGNKDLNKFDAAYIPDNMIRIPGGTFTMGCLNEERDGECYDREKPAHEVTVSTFYMSAHEVTNEQFMVFLNAEGNQEEGGKAWYDEQDSRSRIKQVKNGYEVEVGYEQHPVTHVSWYAARAYARWLSEQTGQNYRLPTEAEWEYAARGGEEGAKDNYLYSGSNNIDAVAWYYGNSGSDKHPVGRKQPNQLGLYDMSGNVREWVQDCMHEDYKGAPGDGSAWLEGDGGSCDRRVVRGGSWDFDFGSRAAYRYGGYADVRVINIGFRLSRN